MNKQLVLVVAVVSGVMLTYGALTIPAQESQEQRPDVFLVMTEATRADHIGPCYGYNRSTAPNICGLAEDGVLFENAYSQGSLTPVSVPSLLTSLPPSGSRVRMAKRGDGRRLSESYTTFPEVLAQEGYALRAGANVSLNRSWLAFANFLQGFNTSFLDPPRQLPPSGPSFMWWFMRDLVHVPFSPAGEYRLWENLSSDRLGEGYYFYSRQEKIDLYDEEVLQADAEIGRLVERLKAEGRYEDSLIIVTSDHGEFFGEHGLNMHGGPPYDEVVHVPLVVKFPGNDFAGTRVEQLVRLVDLAPTLYDYLGIDSSSTEFGTSFLPAINGTDLNLTAYAAGSRGSWSLFDSHYEYVVRNASSPCNLTQGAVEELYQRGETEEDKENFADELQGVVRRLQERRCKIYRAGLKYRHSAEKKRNRAVTERLQELGYLK